MQTWMVTNFQDQRILTWKLKINSKRATLCSI